MDEISKKYSIKNNIINKFYIIENVISILYKLLNDETFKFQRNVEIVQIDELNNELTNISKSFIYNTLFNINTQYFYDDINILGINRYFNKFAKFLKIYVLYKTSNINCVNNKYIEIKKLLVDLRNLNTVHNVIINFDICPRCNINMKLDLINDSYECSECGYFTNKIADYDKVKYFLEANPVVDNNNKNVIDYIKKELRIIYGQSNKYIPSDLISAISDKIIKDKIILENYNIGYKIREIMDIIKDDKRIKGKIDMTKYKKYTSNIYKNLYPNKKIPMLTFTEERFCINFILEFIKQYNQIYNKKYSMNYGYIIYCFINNMLPKSRRYIELLKYIYIQKEDSIIKKDNKTKNIFKSMGYEFTPAPMNYYNNFIK